LVIEIMKHFLMPDACEGTVRNDNVIRDGGKERILVSD
jgi:hypothetical protein